MPCLGTITTTSFVALLLWNSKTTTSINLLLNAAPQLLRLKRLISDMTCMFLRSLQDVWHKQSPDIRACTQTGLPSIYSEFVAGRWDTCQGREEGIGGRAEWSEIDAGCWRKLTAHGNWDLKIICYLSVKTRCEAILDCCSCSPICCGPEWKWPVVQCVLSVYVCVYISFYMQARPRFSPN